MKQLSAIKGWPLTEESTIVTPDVARCFENISFSNHLKAGHISDQVQKDWKQRARSMGLTVSMQDTPKSTEEASRQNPRVNKVEVGDVVSIDRDEDGPWTDNAPEWFAYVEGIPQDKAGSEYLELTWLYRPSDTICADGFYPRTKELFFSDHCNCAHNYEKVYVKDVRRKVPLAMFANNVDHTAEYFIRHTYITPDEDSHKDAAFETLQRSHLACECKSDRMNDLDWVRKHFPPLSTVLVHFDN